MERYRNRGGNSGVRGYDIGQDFIRVKFDGGAVYLYTYESAGQHYIEKMKKLASKGIGLNSFISTTVKKKYAKKER